MHFHRTTAPARAPRPTPCAHAAAAMLLGLAAGTVSAQQAAEAIVITGTLIRGSGPVGTPVVGVTRADIEKTVAANPVELLRQLPQVANLGASDTHLTTTQNANQNVTVGSGINLRGLGPESTLVLVNGRRIAPGGVAGQYTDPSVIPTIAVERMEVLTDGASATYGSDAVGGVVNLRLRRNFTGVEGLLRYGAGDDIFQRQASVIAGRHWASGSIMVAVDRAERSHLGADSRPFYSDDLRPIGGADLRSTNANPGNVQVGGTRYPIPAGQNGSGLTWAQFSSTTANRESAYRGISALPEQNRSSAVFAFNEDLSDKVQLALEGFFSERKFSRELQAQNGVYTVRSTNPFFVGPPGATSVSVNHSFFNELGTSRSVGFERAYQGAAELNVQLPGRWNLSTHLTHSVDQNRNLSPTINTNAVNAALADPNPATSLNLFCDAGALACNNPATLAKLPAFSDRNAKFTMLDLSVKADGPLLALPAGKVRAALGAEAHRDQLPYFLVSNNTTPTTATTRLATNYDTNHERDVKAVFVETYVPLVAPAQKIAGVQQLELSAAVRTEDYSDFGRTTNPKLGLSWVPVLGLELRGTFSKAFRAPTLGDLDPVNGSAVNVVTNRVDTDGRTTPRSILYLGGNADGLQPERATIKTFGLSFKPAAVPGLSASLDWYDIDNRHPTAEQIAAAKANPVYSGQQSESIDTIKIIIDGRRQNAGAVHMTGIDLAARYQMPTASGTWVGGLTATYLTRYRQQFTPTTPMVDGLLNTLNNPLRLRARAELGWERKDLGSASLFVNHTNAYRNTTVTPVETVKSQNTLDLSAKLELGKLLPWAMARGLYLTASVQNLTDEAPPAVRNGTQSFDPQNASAIGRFVAVSLGARY